MPLLHAVLQNSQNTPPASTMALLVAWGRSDGCSYLPDVWSEFPQEQQINRIIRRVLAEYYVGKETCSQILNTWVRFLSRELRPLVFWTDRITITKMLPSQLAAKYPSLRCTLDCTEVFIERPRHMELVVDLVRLQEAQYGEIPDWYSPKC